MPDRYAILAVASEPSVLETFRDLLGREYLILGALSPRQAFAILEAQEVHLVLAEHQLVGMSGADFLRQVRDRHPRPFRLLFPGRADPWVDGEAAGSSHLYRYLARPWDADELQPVIRQALEEWETANPARPDGRQAGPGRHPELRPGERLGQYRLLERLGQGGMGTVYKALHVLLKRVVALKVLRAERVRDAAAVARFRREIRAAGRLAHPNIVQASDARKVKGLTFLVMEFVQGLDLAQIVARRGRLAVADASEVVRQAAVGLQHAHEHGLVHRDVKPANLMLTPQGQVKVLDLGLALLYGELTAAAKPGRDDYLAGTADYMAPEQILGGRTVDTRADIYALGCTLFEFLTGAAPFGSPSFGTVLEKLRAHVQTPVPAVRASRPDVGDELARVLDRFLAKDPAARFPTPAAAAAALEPFARRSDLAALAAPNESKANSATADRSALEPTAAYVSPDQAASPVPDGVPGNGPSARRS